MGAGVPEAAPGAPDTAQGAERQCRICLSGDEDEDSGRLFAPCRCTGSAQLVHVSCLESWRSHATQRQSYFRCDTCKYDYRIERARIAEVLLFFMKDSVAKVLVATLFVCMAFLAGMICARYSPGFLPALLKRLKLPLEVRAALGSTYFNPACFDTESTFNKCCSGPQGDPSCWAFGFTFEHCCTPPSSALHSLRATFLPWIQVLLCGISSLSVFGFARYAWRTVEESLDGGLDGIWNLGISVVWFATLSNDQFGRIAIVIGVGVAMRELYFQYEKVVVQAKVMAQRLGEKVLEVSV